MMWSRSWSRGKAAPGGQGWVPGTPGSHTVCFACLALSASGLMAWKLGPLVVFLTSGSIRSTAYFPQLCTFGGRGTALRCDLPREERSLTTSQRGGCSGCGVLVSLVRLPVFALVSEGQTLSLPFVPLILRTETPPTAQGRLGLGW